MVSKKKGTWKIYIDYIDLNKACLENNYLICKIVHLVDAMARDELLTFIDEYVGYNHISMCEKDQEKVDFITNLC